MSPIEIPLKRKYLTGRRAPNYGINGDHQGHKKPKKIGYDKHVDLYGEPPVRVMVLRNGKARMVTAERLGYGPHGAFRLEEAA